MHTIDKPKKEKTGRRESLLSADWQITRTYIYEAL